jgi:hypothetical protein
MKAIEMRSMRPTRHRAAQRQQKRELPKVFDQQKKLEIYRGCALVGRDPRTGWPCIRPTWRFIDVPVQYPGMEG